MDPMVLKSVLMILLPFFSSLRLVNVDIRSGLGMGVGFVNIDQPRLFRVLLCTI